MSGKGAFRCACWLRCSSFLRNICQRRERRTTLDEAAQHYVHLVLEIGAHEKDFVDAYFGPPEWRIEAEAHPRNISELKAEADRIQSTLSAMDTGAQQPMEHRRNACSRQALRALGLAST